MELKCYSLKIDLKVVLKTAISSGVSTHFSNFSPVFL